MKKILITSAFLALSLPAMAIIKTENCGNYGPTKQNIVVEIDDEDETRVLSTGHEIMGILFPMKVYGCRTLKLGRSQLICDGRIVGAHGPMRREIDDDMLSNGLRANLILNEQAYEITGSCNPRDRKPLTISFF